MFSIKANNNDFLNKEKEDTLHGRVAGNKNCR